MPIMLHCNGSYDDMVRSIIEKRKLACDPSDMVVSYLMNGRRKIYPTFIKNDRHVSLYMLDVVADDFRLLRINVVAMSPVLLPPHLAVDDNDLVKHENSADH
ncbi:hypothetical protein CQW23_12350 [Capsicum baccatum]|uniref:Uncharacterized protein n=1 Tax=Capsicum baccatum TaxID=33114 RepID=A0A2G2WSG8_CAPBA|nr:hypothetical protein CQW23_12350 [Capsicum baccatum]